MRELVDIACHHGRFGAYIGEIDGTSVTLNIVSAHMVGTMIQLEAPDYGMLDIKTENGDTDKEVDLI